MSMRVSDTFSSSALKWGGVAAISFAAGILATKVYHAFQRSVPIPSNNSEKTQSAMKITANDLHAKFEESVNKYLSFIKLISQGQDHTQSIDESSVDPLCHKILNGKLYTSSLDAFIADLLKVYQTQGSWTLTPLETIITPQNNSVVLRLAIEMANQGMFTAIVILRFNENLQIYEINEVLNKMEVSYSFDDGKK